MHPQQYQHLQTILDLDNFQMIDPKNVEEIISSISYVNQVYIVEKKDSIIHGKFQISYAELDQKLDFSFKIYPQYPLKHHASESITFYNEDLIELNHVMKNGSICIIQHIILI